MGYCEAVHCQSSWLRGLNLPLLVSQSLWDHKVKVFAGIILFFIENEIMICLPFTVCCTFLGTFSIQTF